MDVTRAYATLGVSNAATWGDVRRAYRDQLQRYHPDTGVGDISALASVTSAYHELRAQRAAAAVNASSWPTEPPRSGSLVDVYA